MTAKLHALAAKWRERAEAHAQFALDTLREAQNNGPLSHETVSLIAKADALAQAYEHAAAELERLTTATQPVRFRIHSDTGIDGSEGNYDGAITPALLEAFANFTSACQAPTNG